MPNINEFKSRLQGGGARANQFKVTLSFPGYAEVGGETSDLSYLCTATSIPGQTLGVATAAKFQLFEFNDEYTRANFRNLVEPFLRDVQGRRGITDFAVVCDGSNNTSDVIDRNEFRADIFVKPARSINFIQLNFVATRTGVAFSEVVGA